MEYAMMDRNYGNSKRRIFSFGKVDYYYYPGKKRRRINEITLEIEITTRNGYPEFTACAEVWNNIHTDIVAGGQMIDDLYNQFTRLKNNLIYKTIMELWEKYHLKNIADISGMDKEKMDLLFSDKKRSEIYVELDNLNK